MGKILTKADVEHCRVVLPRMAMEANMPEVVDANLLHVVSGVNLLLCCSCCLACGTYSRCLCHAVHLPGHRFFGRSTAGHHWRVLMCSCFLATGHFRIAQVVLLHDL